jgi:hypothetical protein
VTGVDGVVGARVHQLVVAVVKKRDLVEIKLNGIDVKRQPSVVLEQQTVWAVLHLSDIAHPGVVDLSDQQTLYSASSLSSKEILRTEGGWETTPVSERELEDSSRWYGHVHWS